MGEGELVRAQLRALEAWHEARRARYTVALSALADEATRADAAARLERLARQHAALLDRADAAPAARRRSTGVRTVLVGHEPTDLVRATDVLDVVEHLLDLDCAVGVVVAEQPDVVVLGVDLPADELPEAVADLRVFAPGTTVVTYGGELGRPPCALRVPGYPRGCRPADVVGAVRPPVLVSAG